MAELFISHSAKNDAFVRGLRERLADHGQEGWIDSRELRGGDPLWPEIREAIEQAAAFAVVVSGDALQSEWVGKELDHALKVQKKRGRENYPVIPLALDGTKLGVLNKYFKDEPTIIPVSSAAGGIDDAIGSILTALGKRLPADIPAQPQPKAEPLEELVLELTDLKFHEEEGRRRASARARLVYEPATPGQRDVHSQQSWRFVAPLGPIEAEELRWYLEKYAVWPSSYFDDRAATVEKNLVEWGKLLHAAAMPAEHVANVMQAWARIDDHAGRRFSVHVDRALEAGAGDDETDAAQEAATLLLGLPWELLHDGDDFLFQGAKPTRVRRRLPNTRAMDVPVVATPIRILLVTARPEDEACLYIDHRASALPLVEAMERLGGRVQIHVLGQPTLAGLRHELDRARTDRQPYHVVHFDGHGVYDRRVGLGGLCFELPADADKLVNRRHETIFTDQLGPLLMDHRIPLVFLEACQTAAAEEASESVASELLTRGVASVVAMSHSVLVETARRFVESFYRALAGGARVGDAMLAGQRELKDDTFRGRIFGVGEFRLEDWFVPVLYQEKDDPQLFTAVAVDRQAEQDLQAARQRRLGALPNPPATGFIGRSRELLALERLLCGVLPLAKGELEGVASYAVIRGQGGEGKTALAAELARWMVRSGQVRRAAFVSVEMHATAAAVLDALGRQLVPDYSVATFDEVEQAIQKVEQTLREQPVLLVVDNMESILLPPFSRVGTAHQTQHAAVGDQTQHAAVGDQTKNGVVGGAHPTLRDALSEEMNRELDAILSLCERLNAVGQTRLVFTSREPLPAPFDAERNRRELHRLDREDAVKLVERVLNADSRLSLHESAQSDLSRSESRRFDAQQEEIEQLVDAVHGHARTLALLAPALRSRGVRATRESLVELMAEMQRRFPGSREQSVYASVELSLARLSPANRQRAQVLGVFHGGVQLGVLRLMMQSSGVGFQLADNEPETAGIASETLTPRQLSWEESDVASLATELIGTGLATPDPYDHLTLNPALCPYLRASVERLSESLPPAEESRLGESCNSHELQARWAEAMLGYTGFLEQQDSQNAELAQTLTRLELPNLFALLDHVHGAGDAAATIDLATRLFSLLRNAGKPRLLERVAQVREAAAAALGESWNHAGFEAKRTRIEQQLAGGGLREALDGASQLLQRARAEGEDAYDEADYDLAMACFLLARVLQTAGGSQQALPLLDEARQRFEVIANQRANKAAERMAAKCLTEQGDCLRNIGRLDEAAAAYEERIRRGEQLGDERGVAVGQGQLGTVRMLQRRYPEALAAYAEACERFTGLGEPGTVAIVWHQTGMAYQDAGQPEAAEDAYRKSLAISVRLGSVAYQASTLNQLGNLYKGVLDRPEEAAAFYRQAADKYVEIGDTANEGRARNNLADTLRKLGRLDEARQEIRRAITCKEPYGHAAQPWTAWAILGDIETAAANAPAAAAARQKAIDCYLAYRRDGGENHNPDGRISLAVTEKLLAGNAAEAATLLDQLADDANLHPLLRPFIAALQQIAAGSRDRTLADNPEFHPTTAAEILFLIETLEEAVSD